MTPIAMNKFIFDQLKQIASAIDRTLTEENRDRIVGEGLLKRARTSDGRVPAGSVVYLALFNDCLTVIEAAIVADGQVAAEERDQIHPFVSSVARHYARAIPRRYAQFANAGFDDTLPFLLLHRKDNQLYGGDCEVTRWLGLDICWRSAEVSQGREPLDQYRDLMLRLMDEVAAIDGITEEERRARESLEQLIGICTKLEDSEKGLGDRIDLRLRAFTDPSAPEVFHPIAHAHQVWERDPFDVESIHAEARTTFTRLLDRQTQSSEYGRMLLILGESGSGKTHLMRAFRTQIHGERRGFAGYLQMSTKTDHYARYVLQKLIDSLERPFDLPEVEDSALFCISNAVAEAPGLIEPKVLSSIREEELTNEQLARSVSEAADALLSSNAIAGIEIDFLRALIYLQRRDARIKARIIKYLRGGDLTPHDRELIGNIEAKNRDEDPLRLITNLGRMIEWTGQGSLVLLVDQLEDVFSLDESAERFRRAMDVFRSITDEVPSSIVVIACLRDFYKDIRGNLIRAVLDRIEMDPEPIHLTSQRKLEEIESLVSQRLMHLFDAFGAPHDPEDPTFPFRRDQLGQLTNMRTRDVLDWCREHQQRCIAAGRIVEPPTAVELSTPVSKQSIIDIAQEWNDLLTGIGDIPEGESELAMLLAHGLSGAADELTLRTAFSAKAEGRFVSVAAGGQELLVGVCNKNPQGGGLGRQILEVEKEAGARTPVLVRCSEYPSKPSTQIAKQLGALIAKGGRRVVMEEADWRTILAMLQFREKHGKLDAFEKWRLEERPLSGLKPIRALLMLDVEQPRVSADEKPTDRPKKVETKKVAEKKVPPSKPLAAPVAKLILGRTRSLTPETVTLDPRVLTMHGAFLGSSGSGKTTIALNIIEQLAAAGVPSILVDRKGDLCAYARRELWARPAESAELDQRRQQLAERLEVQVFTPGDPNGRPLSIPVIPPGLGELPAHEQAKVARYAASALGGMMNYRESGTDQTRLGILGKAMELLGQTAPEGAVTLAHIIELLHQQDPGLVNAIGRLDTKHFSKLIDNLETLRITRGELLVAGGESLSADLLLGTGDHAKPGKTRMSIISTKFLGDNASIEFWVSRLILEIGRWANKNPKQELQAVLLFDEADNYMPATRKPATKEPLMDLLRRARSAGVGILVATQNPGDLDYKCRDNIRTWFVGRVAQKTAVDKMKPLLSDCRINVSNRLANAGIGEFFQIAEGDVVDLKADRSFMRTEQVPEQEILALARRGRSTAD